MEAEKDGCQDRVGVLKYRPSLPPVMYIKAYSPQQFILKPQNFITMSGILGSNCNLQNGCSSPSDFGVDSDEDTKNGTLEQVALEM